MKTNSERVENIVGKGEKILGEDGVIKSRLCIVLTGYVLRRLDLSNIMHRRPLVRGDNITR